MPPLGSFVFMDLNCSRSRSIRITEISLLAVPLGHYLALENLEEPQDKLTLHFLSEADFNTDRFNEINAFINRQTQPVCLISYHGTKFDFPILMRRFQDINVRLSEDVMCADSLHAFFDVHNFETNGVPFGNADRSIFYEGNPKPAISFTLKETFGRIVGDHDVLNPHVSEEANRMAATASIHLGRRFLDWVEQNQRNLTTVRPLELPFFSRN